MDARPPLFSVVIPVYNGEAYLSEAIESVRSQTDSDWELIIVDDASQDRTPEILSYYAGQDQRIRLFRNAENVRAAKSLNEGIAQAKGRWIVHLDADDFFDCRYFETLRTYVENSPDDHFFSAWVTIVDESSKEILNMRLPNEKKIQRMMKVENFLYHSATVFSKELWKKTGGYPDENPYAAEDVALWKRFFENKARLRMIPEFLVYYRLHHTNMTSLKDANCHSKAPDARDEKMLRQNGEWKASLFLKQNMKKSAREEIFKLVKHCGGWSFKNIQYLLLTFSPKSFVRFYMWECRPYLRSLSKQIKTPRS